VKAKIDRMGFELQSVKSKLQAMPRFLAGMLEKREKRGK
jgi:hypothetical protein